MMRKMHVPTYWPVVFGVQLSEYRGVDVEVKKVIIMSAMPIIIEPPPISIDPCPDMSDVEDAMAPLEVAVMDIDVELMSMFRVEASDKNGRWISGDDEFFCAQQSAQSSHQAATILTKARHRAPSTSSACATTTFAMAHSHMAMSMDSPPRWLDQPVMLHSSRAYKCSLNHTEQCEYQQGYWRFWYELDHRYALPTVAFFMTAIILFAIPFILAPFVSSTARSKQVRRILALNRYLSYRAYRIPLLNWNSAPIGVLLLGAVGTIFFFSMTLGPKPYYWPNEKNPETGKVTLSFGNSPPIASRSGWMSLACLPFIIATSSKSNLITTITGVSHEKLQVFHRWISYACFVLALIHTFPFIVYHIWKGDMVKSWNEDVFYWTGVVALVAQAWLTFASFSPLRNLCYEFFKVSHFLAALIFVVFFFLHCDFRLSSWDYFIATGVIFSLTFLHSQLRIYFQHGLKKANISLASNGFIKVSVPTKTTWRAGQHYFIRFIGLGTHGLTAHPFTACSLPSKAHYYEAKDSELVFYIRPQGGFTARLAKFAHKHPNASMRVLLDGPYGGIDMRKLASSQKTLALAGGSGAGWLLPLIEAFLRRRDCLSETSKMGCSDHQEEAPEMKVILATRDLATRNWFEEAIRDLLATSLTGCCPSGLAVDIYYTARREEKQNAPGKFLQALDDAEIKIAAAAETSSKSSDSSDSAPLLSATHHASRPNLPATIREEAAAQSTSSVRVFCCGPLSMQNDVQNAVAREQLRVLKDGSKDVYLHMEHFSWT
ncbi:hypothetical protein AC578_5141 [Pseudocercospora eumusae]|uniref:ferric-chelate reductase (NADPH) n=1 Tax=Pseudocercospora eumusae TaxID=321146 RepID=A0A139HMQ6_9PEZI|nr:hypothetical protein AC578_5141 [Pseudocercospora eumusae]